VPRQRLLLPEVTLPAVTVALGLELLRLEFTAVTGVYRDRLNGSLVGAAAIELGTLALGLLAPLACRALGLRRCLAATAAGVALTRLVVQLVPWASARLLLAPVGVVLLLWFVPAYLAATHGRPAGRWFGPSLLAGLAVDTALHGAWGTWDHAWTLSPPAVALTAALAAAVLLALRRFLAGDAPEARDPSITAALPLAGLGAALFLHALLWQNVARQTVFLGQPQQRAFLFVMVANGLALVAAAAAAVGVPALPVGWLVTGAAGGLLLATVLERRAPLAALLLGQVAAGLAVGWIGRRAATGRAERPGLRRTGAAWGAGMLLFGVLMVASYVGFERRVPFRYDWVPPIAAAVVAAAGAGALLGLGRAGEAPWPRPARPAAARSRAHAQPSLVVLLGLALLLAPAVMRPPARMALEPARGYPVRVMSYNLHGGFSPDGRMDLEGVARAVQASGAEVVGLQEVTRGWYSGGSTDLLAWLGRRLRMPQAVFAGESDRQSGNALLSRRPILASGVVYLPRGRAALARNYLWADVDLGAGQRLRVIVTHLHSGKASRGSAALRVAQVTRVVQDWGGRPATALLGDLNTAPDSPEVGLLAAAGLRDAWRTGGGGAADELTHPSDRPVERVDYVWLSPDLRATGFSAADSTASDHRALSVTVQPR
jgi:endonuclease/exonuclease/phosphatase family metal-dependent hydrolase